MNEYLRPYIMRRFIIPGSILLVVLVGGIAYFASSFKAAQNPGAQQGLTQSSASCPIKGNINEKGERIYHVPGDQWYSSTKLDVSKGERWFCSEKEALAAGWRPPSR